MSLALVDKSLHLITVPGLEFDNPRKHQEGVQGGKPWLRAQGVRLKSIAIGSIHYLDIF